MHPQKKDKNRREGKGRRCCSGDGIASIPCSTSILYRDDMLKRMYIITATWRNGCYGKMDDHPVHTIPNHHPTKIDVLPNRDVNVSVFFMIEHFIFFSSQKNFVSFRFCLKYKKITNVFEYFDIEKKCSPTFAKLFFRFSKK